MSIALRSNSCIFYFADKICYIEVTFPEVIEVNQQTELCIHLYDTHNASYKGIVNINITSDLQSSILQFVNSPDSIKTYLSYGVSSINDVTFKVIANNHVSEKLVNFSAKVVRKSFHKPINIDFCTALTAVRYQHYLDIEIQRQNIISR